MTLSVERRFEDGAWRTIVREEGAAAFSGVELVKNVHQSGLPVNSVPVDVTWQVATYDTDGYFAAPGPEITIPSDGYYLLVATILGFDASGVDGQIYLYLQASDSQARTVEAQYNGTENEFAVTNTAIMRLDAGVTVKALAALTTLGGGTTFQINGENQGALTSFTASRLGAA